MATFRTYAELLTPGHPLMRPGRIIAGGGLPGVVLADVLRRAGGVYEATTPLTARLRDDIRAAAELTSDDRLLAIAELAEALVSLDNCRQLDPLVRIAMFCRLDVSPAETPRWRPIAPGGIPAAQRPEIDGLLRAGRGARVEEHVVPDGRFWRYVGPAGDLPRTYAATKVTPAVDSAAD